MKTIEEPKLVKIDLRNLCPNDPNFKKITEAGGWVLPEDGPQHQGGWFTEQKVVQEEKITYTAEGRQVKFMVDHMTAVRVCQRCGGKTFLDPYP
jgi:hypothetical protein